MKKTLLLLLLTLLTASAANAATPGRDFTFTYEGQTLIYTVLDEDAKTCEPKQGRASTSTAVNKISGDLIIPQFASDGKDNFTVVSISTHAFASCDNLTSVSIPESATEIKLGAFGDCSKLESIIIPKSVSVIGQAAFSNCTNLSSVTIPKSVISIGACAFMRCSSLTSIDLPESLESIDDGAFAYCDLSSILIPKSVTMIGKYAFACNNLGSIEVDSENTDYISVDGILFSKDLSTLVAFPAGKEIEHYIIPESTTTIYSYAFYLCSKLNKVTLPKSITSIGSSAFSGCSNLTEVECLSEDPCTADEGIFSKSTYENATLYVPMGTVPFYQATTPWNKFLNISDEPLLSGIEDVVADGVDAIDFAMPYEVYNLQGALVGQSTDGLAAGVYIVRQGEKSAKVAIR